jgi:hypothetical protein
MSDRLQEQTRKSDYNQSSGQDSFSTDTTTQSAEKVSQASTLGKSIQAGDQTEFVNIGCNVQFTVKIRGGFPTTPTNC